MNSKHNIGMNNFDRLMRVGDMVVVQKLEHTRTHTHTKYTEVS